MTEPFKLRVQKALTAELETITPDNGWYSDLSPISNADGTTTPRVYRGRAIFGEDDPLPMVSLLEEAISPETDLGPPSNGSGVGPYNMILQGFVADNPVNPTDPAHWLMADVKRKLAGIRAQEDTPNGILGFGRKSPIVLSMDFDGGVVRPPDGEVSAKAYFWLKLSLILTEAHETPVG